MASETILDQLPGSAPNERVLICLDQRGRDWGVSLRQQHWAEGIGWYDQKVLRLDARQWRAFRAAVSSHLPPPPKTVAEPPVSIPFPGPKEPSAERPTAVEHA